MLYVKYNICPNLHAMSDMGFASDAKPGNIKYSRPRTCDAECYAEKCHRKGQCLFATNIKRGKVINSAGGTA